MVRSNIRRKTPAFRLDFWKAFRIWVRSSIISHLCTLRHLPLVLHEFVPAVLWSRMICQNRDYIHLSIHDVNSVLHWSGHRPITFTRMFEPRHNKRSTVLSNVRKYMLKHSRESNRPVAGAILAELGTYMLCKRALAANEFKAGLRTMFFSIPVLHN